MDSSTQFAGRSVLITGTNRGLGTALVDEALRRGAGRVYAAARRPVTHDDARVTPLLFDITDPGQVRRAAAQVEELDVLVNNAALALFDDLSDRAAIEQHLTVNLFGTWDVTRAFLPTLTARRGTIVNVLSTAAFAPVPVIPAYSISKAAAWSMTQSLRALTAPAGAQVHVVLPGPIDTDMSRGLEIPKASPESVAAAIFDGVRDGVDDIFPDPTSGIVAPSWRSGAAKSMEIENAALVAAMAAGAAA
jgi:NAD(P)-dependent dehydrogenase (short-subunit alcohol dehydrogenase family)